MSTYDNFTKLAALGAAGYLIYKMRQAQKMEAKTDETSTIRMAEYRPASHLFWNPIVATKVYRDGPISWVAEDSHGAKWVAYTGSDTPPKFFRLNAVHKNNL